MLSLDSNLNEYTNTKNEQIREDTIEYAYHYPEWYMRILISYPYNQNKVRYFNQNRMELKRFVKMHGAGNDFIIVQPQFFSLPNLRLINDTFSSQEIAKISPIAAQLCKRHFSIGADGLLIVSDVGGTFKMSVFNSNGSTAKNCGNGLRCVVAYLYWSKKMPKIFKVATDSGDKDVQVFETENGELQVSLNLGTPSPIEKLEVEIDRHPILDKYLQKSQIYHGGLGNCHLIVFLQHQSFSKLEQDNAYAEVASQLIKIKQANVNFCLIQSSQILRIVTCQLGAGVTLACGTGSTTSAFVGHKIGKLDAVVAVHTKGGVLSITSEKKEGEEYHLHLKGPAKWVYSGEINLKM